MCQATQSHPVPNCSDSFVGYQIYVANLHVEWLLPVKNDIRAGTRSSAAEMEKMTRKRLYPSAVHLHVGGAV